MARSRGRRTSASSGCRGTADERSGEEETTLIRNVLVPNRSEIARRVFATCRRLGIGTVGVYTEPDADAPHVGEADVRVKLPGTDGYLNGDALTTAARAAGAAAIHPGSGFLSENADFAAA